MVSFFGALARHAIRRPGIALIVAALAGLIAAPGIWRLKLRTDGHALASESSPEVVYDRAVRKHFGIADQIVVRLHSHHADGIFNPGSIQLIRDLTAQFSQLEEIGPANVLSLATEINFRCRPGSYENQRLLEPALTNKSELDQLREDVHRIELYTGTLVSGDGTSALILVGVPTSADRSQIHRRVQQIINTHQGAPDEIGLTGTPVAESLLGIQILDDLGVPQALLGVNGQRRTGPEKFKLPGSLHEVRQFLAGRFGLVPVAALVMMLVFYLCFRNVLAVLLPLPGIAATLVFVFGLMGWCGVPIYLTTAVMPVLLIVISVTNDIYLLSRYFHLIREHPAADNIELVGATFDQLVRPVACTSLTAAIGFLSFGFSPLAPVRAFGLFTGIATLFGLFFSLTAVPALLVLVNPVWSSRRPRAGMAATAPLARGFARVGQIVVRRRGWVLGIALGIAALTPLGLGRLIVQDSWVSGFDPENEFRRVTREVNGHFFGMHQLLVSADAPEVLTGTLAVDAASADSILLPGNLVADPTLIEGNLITLSIPAGEPSGSTGERAHEWRTRIEAAFHRGEQIVARIPREPAPARFFDEWRKTGHASFAIVVRTHTRPELLRALASLASFIREKQEYAVGGVLGPADYLVTIRFMLRPADPQARRFPETASEVKLLWNSCVLALGPQRFHQVVDMDCRQSLTTIFLKDANFVDTAKLMFAIQEYAREHLAPKGIKIGFAGDVAVSQSLVRGIVTTQLQSLIWSLLGIFAITALFGGSFRWGFYCLLPSALAVLIKFAVMGWCGIPLGVATSMFAAMTLGIGVNCAIHLLEGCRQAGAAGATTAEALSRSLELTGPPALINTLAMSLGFGVLMLSQVPANARLGLLVVLGLVNCFIASILLLPLLLRRLPTISRDQ